MKEFEIWSEGFNIQGESAQAHLIAKIEADTWDDAIKKYIDRNPGRLDYREGVYTDWGCRLFDNEADARKSFG